MTNLTGIRLEATSPSDVSSISNLGKLTFISLNQNRIAGGVALNALTNLQSCYLGQNRIQNIPGSGVAAGSL